LNPCLQVSVFKGSYVKTGRCDLSGTDYAISPIERCNQTGTGAKEFEGTGRDGSSWKEGREFREFEKICGIRGKKD
jgi:hypothetical protein